MAPMDLVKQIRALLSTSSLHRATSVITKGVARLVERVPGGVVAVVEHRELVAAAVRAGLAALIYVVRVEGRLGLDGGAEPVAEAAVLFDVMMTSLVQHTPAL